MAPIASPELGESKREKKHKKDKKRAREEDAAIDTERKHKKSKSVPAADLPQNGTETNGDHKPSKKDKKHKKHKPNNGSVDLATEVPLAEVEKKEKKDKKKKKHKEKSAEEATADPEPTAPATVDEERKERKKKKKQKQQEEEQQHTEAVDAPSTSTSKSEKKSKKKEKKHRTEDESGEVKATQDDPEVTQPNDVDAMDVDAAPVSSSKSSKIHQPSDIPSDPQFPFYNQTVSLYEPIYPNGWAQPISGCETQHLRHLQNRYVPSLRGVLLDYSNVTLGHKPGRAGAAADDDSPAVLYSRAEFAGGFGWITADVRLFMPSRGSWMEGSVNLQTEGHIGVVCFGRFNASIEALRLPPSWKWVPNEDASGFEDSASVFTAPDEHGVVKQIHSTGHWIDEDGEKVRGRVRFRIRNFDVGVSGQLTFLSLQGTMLDRMAEKQLVAQEASEARERAQRKGGRGAPVRRRVPEFSMTTFAGDEEQPQNPEPEMVPEPEQTDAEKEQGQGQEQDADSVVEESD